VDATWLKEQAEWMEEEDKDEDKEKEGEKEEEELLFSLGLQTSL
jgi:hypothetical protein